MSRHDSSLALLGRTTFTDSAAAELAARGPLVRLRQWASDILYPLPRATSSDPKARLIIGTDESSQLRLSDTRASHRHAALFLRSGNWHMRDLDSKNGVWRDGIRSSGFVVTPGMEIRIGRTVLIPENEPAIALRGFLARILGWGADHLEDIDLALRSIRAAIARRSELVLVGEGDLVPIALALHRHTLGQRPFVTCDPRRGDTEESVRSAANRRRARDAYNAATAGTMCVRSNRLPKDLGDVIPLLRSPDTRVQVVVCAGQRPLTDAVLSAPVLIPPLRARRAELPRIIEEYAVEAEQALELKPGSVDRAWVLKHAASSLSEIEKATLRAAAVVSSRTVNAAAGRLGMRQVSLARWFRRRAPPESMR
jgi:hypothetical protein